MCVCVCGVGGGGMGGVWHSTLARNHTLPYWVWLQKVQTISSGQSPDTDRRTDRAIPAYSPPPPPATPPPLHVTVTEKGCGEGQEGVGWGGEIKSLGYKSSEILTCRYPGKLSSSFPLRDFLGRFLGFSWSSAISPSPPAHPHQQDMGTSGHGYIRTNCKDQYLIL